MRLPAAVLLAGLALGVALAPAWPEEGAPGVPEPFFFQVDGLRWYFTWGADKIPTGADLTFGYRGWQPFPGVQTILQASLGAGYEGRLTYRDVDYSPHHEIPPEAAAGHDLRLEFNSPRLQWELGVVQGILWNPRLERNWLEAFAFGRGRYERYLDGRAYWCTDPGRVADIEAYHEAWQQAYAGTDAEGILGTSFLVGLDLDGLLFDPRTRSWDGYYAEFSFEASPWFPAVMGATDFWRVNLSAMGFRTLYRGAGSSARPGITIYLGDFFSIDYADARRAMPLYVMQSFGGRNPRQGLGDEGVRGFEAYSWDTQLKILNNLEVRFNLPPFWAVDDERRALMPGLLAFLDAGYGAGFWGDPEGTPGGFLMSTGVGIYLDLFDVIYAVGYLCVPLVGSRLDGEALALDLDFGLQF
ncbi:MAG: hypothetical protein JW820_00005 [Spirochaetales bacterium]|nr:hypothetical protein [Spirochaetales bacterium]